MRWRERGRGGEGGFRANPSAETTYATPVPSQEHPLRGPSPHPRPLSPTRGEGSKTVRPHAQLPGENRADRLLGSRALLPLARWRERGAGGEGGVRANPSTQSTYAHRSHACALNRFSPSPAGGRGGRGVRVVTAQPQAPQSFTRADRKQSQSRALLPLARWRNTVRHEIWA